MPSKQKVTYVCTACGAEYGKWQGRCTACGEWNTVEEQVQVRPAAGGAVRHAVVQRMTDIRQGDQQRYHTGLKELDRVLGGGIVRGALMLIGGDPGIGKSTLLLQIWRPPGHAAKDPLCFRRGVRGADQAAGGSPAGDHGQAVCPV